MTWDDIKNLFDTGQEDEALIEITRGLYRTLPYTMKGGARDTLARAYSILDRRARRASPSLTRMLAHVRGCVVCLACFHPVCLASWTEKGCVEGAKCPDEEYLCAVGRDIWRGCESEIDEARFRVGEDIQRRALERGLEKTPAADPIENLTPRQRRLHEEIGRSLSAQQKKRRPS